MPLIAITGVTGVFFRALAVTVGVALLASLTLALTWTPNLCLYLLRNKPAPDADLPGGKVSDVTSPEASTGGAETETTDDLKDLTPEQLELRRMAALEERSMGNTMNRVIGFYDRWFRRAIDRPWLLAVLAVVLIAVSYVCYRHIGSDLLPEIDEGSFIIDYVTPPGSSLEESNRMLNHILQIVRSVPEVANTSRRTGLQLGLAAVTEANTGDISVKLKTQRSRSVWQIMDEIRGKIEQQEPAVSVDFVQKLQDMIGDLTSAPQPIFIELFSPNAELIDSWAPKVADAIGKIDVGGKHPVVDIDNGIDSTTSGPAIVYHVNMAAAAQAGFTPQDV
ncbi:MAG TPA: efflux RND transporter permease subunit, partial [Mycobacterium sp.]|nr:efflux RND transporter permease subunit [Mycobacterium sp.]